MARKTQADSGTLFNPVSLSLLAFALLVLDVVINRIVTNPVETLIIGVSGVLFGLALAYTMIGKKRPNHSLAVFLLIMYVLAAVVLYLIKYIYA